MIMAKSAHDRALDIAARRYLTWMVCAGRPPAYNGDDWPECKTDNWPECKTDNSAQRMGPQPRTHAGINDRACGELRPRPNPPSSHS